MKTRNIVIDLSGKRPGVWMSDGPVNVTFVRGEDDLSTEPEDFEYLGEYSVSSEWSTKEEVQDFVDDVKAFGRDSADDSNGVVDGEEETNDDVFLDGVPEGCICVVMRGDDGGVYNIPGDYSEIIGGYLHVYDSTNPLRLTVDGGTFAVSVATFPITNVEAVIRG